MTLAGAGLGDANTDGMASSDKQPAKQAKARVGLIDGDSSCMESV